VSTARRWLGQAVAVVNPQCRHARALYIIGHMRCGSTALSNILCSRDDVSGYGEGHFGYQQPGALGVLALKQMKRGRWKPGATYLFDKILHSRFDIEAEADFFTARAIFMVRRPAEVIRSIRKLYESIGSDEYSTDDAAADYYAERLEAMLALWGRFSPGRRAGLSHDALTSDTDAQLARISRHVGLNPPLINAYRRPNTVAAPGVGDPLSSHKFDRIVAAGRATSVSDQSRALALTPARFDELEALYARCLAAFARE
jgi:hypothetical protein